MWLDRDEDTICALSTAEGAAGIAVLRVSGASALKIVSKIAAFLPATAVSHRIFYGKLSSLNKDIGTLDEVLVSYFASGRSYTGEETLEISCHGGGVLSRRILGELVEAGCRMAERGEFTYRAFMNQRLDLVQAESVLALIEAKSDRAASLALRQLEGELSLNLKEIESGLVSVMAHLEANIDFAAEDIVVAKDDDLFLRLKKIGDQVRCLVDSYKVGQVVKEGLRVALVGRPNVGKSSFLNWMLEQDRAIVTNEPGTTRDVVEGSIYFEGLPVSFLDTAGVRESQSLIEKLGIERSLQAAADADLCFLIFDASEGLGDEELELAAKIPAEKLVLIGNKKDRLESGAIESERPVIYVSALEKNGKDRVKGVLSEHFKSFMSEDSSVVCQSRQYELLVGVLSFIDNGLEVIGKASPEFVIFEIQSALHGVYKILGVEFDDQVMDRVFGEFCLGK